ncbi:ATP-dependent endonuclease [Arthrobacter sp. RCC_34]|uniref:ATP-dependent nuclease n=1 Tax=Arthrobacter sp. RCC_34 TaxID=3239230 RepID=UPI003524F187
MKITSVEIANFKAIRRAKLNLHPTFNVLVGSNGSGKSSVLQALHWILQSGRNRVVATNSAGRASTLSEKDAIFMPSPEYKSAGHGTDYGNNQRNPQLDVNVSAIDDRGNEVAAHLWLKAARNEGISVHVPSGNSFVSAVRDRRREISAYIPGLAGIPLIEEKKSKLVVHRSAAAGDANMVLRNMLDLLRREKVEGKNGLDVVSELVSRVMGDFSLRVEFDEETHSRVIASFRTGEMGNHREKSFRPLELAGIGYLQVLQIFCYLVYFRPLLLLVDEPDAHLYPIAQERLVEVLCEVAERFGSQVILTTHSPSIVRALPQDSKVIWMKDGRVEETREGQARQLMGWGLLDRKIILLTEDSKTEMLRSLVSQWPDLERVTAIWPFAGTGKLPTPETLEGFRALVGNDVRLVVHRDRDFLMPDEVDRFKAPYNSKGCQVWVTKYSDIEAYWTSISAVSLGFGVSEDGASALIEEAVKRASVDDQAMRKLRTKRNEISRLFNGDGKFQQFGEMEVVEEAARAGSQFAVLGKLLLKKVREIATESGWAAANSYGKSVPEGIGSEFAGDLERVLRGSIS